MTVNKARRILKNKYSEEEVRLMITFLTDLAELQILQDKSSTQPK